MMKVYLDNAATTPIAPEVLDVIVDVLSKDFGNPSSSHSEGRKAKAKLESARKNIAKIVNATPAEIVFTSGGTEANNLALKSVIADGEVTRVITTDIEHHAVLNTLKHFCEIGNIELVKLKINDRGEIDTNELKSLLVAEQKTLVSLMHGNNEIGNLIDIELVASLCSEYGAIFHCDTVQTIGHKTFDLKKLKIDFITCSAHKIHGPKGVGFLYVNKKRKLTPLFYGGLQERGLRPGTENVASITGMAKALELAYSSLEKNEECINKRKQLLISLLKRRVKDVVFNGSVKDSMSTIVNARFKTKIEASMLLFQLDLKGVCVSGGSACSSGSLKGSHVLSAMNEIGESPSLRFSFSRSTSIEEIEYTVTCLTGILQK
jgi:cysteine desulfurase